MVTWIGSAHPPVRDNEGRTMSLSAGDREDRHRTWRLTATIGAGVLAVIVAAACSMGGGDDDGDDDDDDDDDSMRVVQIVGAGSSGIAAGPHGAATALPTTGNWVVVAH